MKTMLLIAALTLGGASVTNAQTPADANGAAVPRYSRTVTDEYMNPSQAPNGLAREASREVPCAIICYR